MRILMRCDGGGSLGVGHVMRSLALAEAAVAAGHDVLVAGRFEGTFLQGQLATAPVEVVQLSSPADNGPDDLVDLVRRLSPDVLHVDSYAASERLRDLVAATGFQARVPATVLGNIVFSNMEDGAFGRRPADVVVDPTLGAELSARPDDGSTWLLCGSRYSPLRRRVIDAARASAAETTMGAARSVLVVMGGTDPSGMAPVAVELLARTGIALQVTVIAAGENVRRARAAAQDSALSLSILGPVDDLPSLMTGHDLVVSAAGTSVWELLCIGVPTAVAWTVDNQREGYDRVVSAGAAIGLGGPGLSADGPAADGHVADGPAGDGHVADGHVVDLLRSVLTDSKARADLVRAGHRVVDGLGAWRVVRTWEMAQRANVSLPRQSKPGSEVVFARLASLNDARLLWLWRNDPVTRASSRSPDEVPWDEHLRWVAATLARSDRRLFLVADAVGPVGTVRWDRVRMSAEDPSSGPGQSQEWEVSVTVAPQRRGQSLARPLLRAGEKALVRTPEGTPGQISARISDGNEGTADGIDVATRGTAQGARSRGTMVTAYLAVVHVGNVASIRLFETSDYVPDLPPDPRGFMRYRKTARVP